MGNSPTLASGHRGVPPIFLRKSAQDAGKTKDSGDPKNERVRKSLKRLQRRVQEINDKREGMAERRGPRVDRTGLCPSVTAKNSMGIVTLSIVNYMVYDSNGWWGKSGVGS